MGIRIDENRARFTGESVRVDLCSSGTERGFSKEDSAFWP